MKDSGLIKFREITEEDDAILAGIIRANLEAAGLDIPGTAYFDPELDHDNPFAESDLPIAGLSEDADEEV